MNESTKQICASCRLPKGQYQCGLCEDHLCRGCAIFQEENKFSFLTFVPEELRHSFYCTPCYQTQVEPELESYNEIMERARGVYFFFTSQKKNMIPLIKRARERINVSECVDRDETVMRLGFLAASQGYNAVIEAEVKSEQVRNHGWQKSKWSGQGVPANVDTIKMERLERQEEGY